ncbi:MAG: hypothetical protein HYR84_15515 [Planctomycetes bacterium]|nr:hypothetical protein [Planctomycetota bacterium]
MSSTPVQQVVDKLRHHVALEQTSNGVRPGLYQVRFDTVCWLPRPSTPDRRHGNRGGAEGVGLGD